MSVERAGGRFTPHLEEVSGLPPESPLFGEFVVARFDEDGVFADEEGLDQFLGWLEAPERSPALRLFVVAAIFQRGLEEDEAPLGARRQLARSALRILAAAPSDDALAAQLVDTYLPNLLGIEGAAAPVTQQTVFRGAADARPRAREALSSRPESPARDRLLDWIGP